jgi:hypothetical protein
MTDNPRFFFAFCGSNFALREFNAENRLRCLALAAKSAMAFFGFSGRSGDLRLFLLNTNGHTR